MAQQVRVRAAPSPTGNLHVGTAQSILYNWLFARKNNGRFFMRIEDTDRARSTQEYEQNILENLKWLGLEWDGNIVHSSDNNSRYQELLAKLLTEGKAFYCHHSKEELETERKTQEQNKELPRHSCVHKHTQEGTTPGGIVRLVVDEHSERTIAFEDQIRGKIEFKQALLGDFSIGRSVEDALYHFAVVVDDADMQITHVIRGEDHISNTPKQILIYEALGLPVPLFAHLPLLLAPDRSKLSKRHGATAVADYKTDYLPDALTNFLANLSYTFSQEILSKEAMLSEFELAKIHHSGAVFDVQKLDWLNGEYIKKLSDNDLVEKLIAHVGEQHKTVITKILPMVRERIKKFSEVKEFQFFFQQPEYDTTLLNWKDSPPTKTKEALTLIKNTLEGHEWLPQTVRTYLDAMGEQLGGRGLAYWPFRVALTGLKASPDPVDVAMILGKKETLERVKTAIDKLS